MSTKVLIGTAWTHHRLDETWHEALDMYVLTAACMAHAVTPIMMAQGGGAIVNISSIDATEPRLGMRR